MGTEMEGKNKRRSCEEKVNLIEEYYNSGMGYKVFAESQGISPSLFYSWVQKYEDGGIEGLRHKRKKAPRMDSITKEILRLKIIIAEQQVEIKKLKELLLEKE